MNAFSQECSSGCESGWTLYLEQSFLLNNNNNNNTKNPRNKNNNISENYVRDEEEEEEMMMREDNEEEEEDLSMVSDASSGPPPHIHYDEESYYSLNCYDNGGSCKDTTLVSNGEIRRQNERPHRRGRRQGDKDPEIAVPSHFLADTASSPAINNWSKSTLDYSQAGVGYSSTHFQGRSAYQDHFGYVQPPFSGNHYQNNQWF